MEQYLQRHLAKAANVGFITPGQEVSLKVDLILAHDGTGPALLEHWGQRSGKRASTSKALFTLDHAFPAPTIKDRKFQKAFREFCQQQDITLYQNGEGVLHQVVAEEETIWPGMIIVGADGHVATAGAFGAIAFSVSSEKLIPVLENGHFAVQVPEQVTISIEGYLPQNVLPRDVAFYVVSKLKAKIKGKAVALTGSLFQKLSLAGKMSICNYLPEGGAVTALILPEDELVQADYTLKADEIEPLVAVSPSPTSITSVHEVDGTEISMAIAGGCSAGRLEDMKVIANILKGKRVHPLVTFVITPASKKVLDEMENLGISRLIRDAGAVIMPPGCGSCPGKHFGLLAEDDVAITTTIRNNPGRIGSEGAQIYLASPRTVAQSAISGRITVIK